MKKSNSITYLGTALVCALGLAVACGDSGSADTEDDSGDSTDNMTGDGDSGGDGDGDDGGGDGDSMDGMGGNGSSACAEACQDDGNPCTEDVCNEDTGECGIPRSGNSCDDGVYCNGEDTCDEGQCTAHAGDPCSDTSCNEGRKACECADVSHCPGADLTGSIHAEDGDWGTVSMSEECTYDPANPCDEDCSCLGTVTTYECVAGFCESDDSAVSDSECGSRDTDGTTCENGSNLFCDGAETCSSGVCTAPGDPCGGTSEPYCVEGQMSCFECTGNATDGSAGCENDEICCRGTCQADDAICSVPFQNLTLQNVILKNIIAQNVVVQNLNQNVVVQNLNQNLVVQNLNQNLVLQNFNQNLAVQNTRQNLAVQNTRQNSIAQNLIVQLTRQ